MPEVVIAATYQRRLRNTSRNPEWLPAQPVEMQQIDFFA
jgi:hypothetical protein